jgi:acyl carrier protein
VIVAKPEIFATLRSYLEEMFELPAEKITPESRLFEDLDLDSIDAVELVVKLQEYTGKKIAPAEFKTVRSVGDIVDRLYEQLSTRT